MAACYFDVDGTLVRTNLVHPTVYYMVNQPSPLGSLRKVGRALLGAPRMALAELQDRRLFNELLFTIYEDINKNQLLTLAPEVARDDMREQIRKKIKTLRRLA